MGEINIENGFRWRMQEIERRVAIIESTKPEVIADNVRTLAEDVRSLRRAFYTFCFGSVGAAIVFAFSVFALVGQ